MKKVINILLLCLFILGCTRPKQYADYSRHSGFDRTEIDSATLRNLEVLGRVWGVREISPSGIFGRPVRLGFRTFRVAASGRRYRSCRPQRDIGPVDQP